MQYTNLIAASVEMLSENSPTAYITYSHNTQAPTHTNIEKKKKDSSLYLDFGYIVANITIII